MIVKCLVPWCKEIGEGVAGRPHTCAKHTQYVTAAARGLKSVAQAAVVEGGKQVRKEIKMPWFVTAFYDGVRNGGRE